VSVLLIDPDRNLQPFRNALKSIDLNLDQDIRPDFANMRRVSLAVALHRPGIKLLPHDAAMTDLNESAQQLIDNNKRLLSE
jgi:hypothetical protein